MSEREELSGPLRWPSEIEAVRRSNEATPMRDNFGGVTGPSPLDPSEQAAFEKGLNLPASDSYPQLPLSVFWGSLGEYVQIMSPTTEAPSEFHFGAIATVASALFSNNYIQMGTRKLHPNLFSVLAGPTGVSHKTTVAEAAMRLVDLVEEGAVEVLRGLGSPEGLLNALPAGQPALWRVPEYTSVIKKGAKGSATSNLVELQLQLYDRPPSIKNHTIGNPIVVDNPNVAMLGDSTEAFLTETFSNAVLSNGILNRLSLWLGQRGDPIPFPPDVDGQLKNRLVGKMHDALEIARESDELKIEPDAEALWDELYRNQVYPRQSTPEGEVIARLSETPWKFAILYAVTDQRTAITVDDLESGWLVANYLADCAIRVAGQIGMSDRAQLMNEVVKAVERTDGLPTPGYLARELSQKWRGKLDDYGGAQQILAQLIRDHRIDGVEENGPYHPIYRGSPSV